jgi:hypothetical protein
MNIALLISSILSAVVSNDPAIPQQIASTIGGIAAGLTGVLKSGVTTNINASTVLIALSAVISQIKAVDPKLLKPGTVDLIATLDNATVAALAADQEAQAKVDATELHQEAPLA